MTPRRPHALLRQPAQAAVRRLALAQLRSARKAVKRLERRQSEEAGAADAEALYEFRVAIRRLRTTSRAYRRLLAGSVGKGALRKLRRLARDSGTARDIEAQLEWVESSTPHLPSRARVGARWLAARLRARLVAEEREIFAWIVGTFTPMHRKLRGRLRRYTMEHRLDRETIARPFAWAAAEQLDEHHARLTRRLEELRDGTIVAPEAAHEARLAGKRLRYLIEAVAPERREADDIANELKELQDVLGVLGDAEMLARTLEEAEREARSTTPEEEPALADAAPPKPRRARASPVTGLRALARRLEVERDAAVSALRSRWLGSEPPEFATALAALTVGLRRVSPAGVEIERKFLLNDMPPQAVEAPPSELRQGYLPGVRLVERIRREQRPDGTVRHFRTVKDGEGVIRLEIEEETTPELFAALWPLTEGRRVEKVRHAVQNGSHSWEIDRFTDRALVLCEVELRSADEEPVIPDWLAPYIVREVTGDAAYVNRNLAR